MKKPDWKCIEDYQYIDQQDPVAWAWEFLRRNEEYRADYRALSSGKWIGPIYIPPKIKDETEKQWLGRCIREDVEPQRIDRVVYFVRKWGLKHRMLDPSLSAHELKVNGETVEFDDEYQPTILKTWDQVERLPVYDDETGTILIGEDKLVAVLDMTAPIPPQIKELNRLAKAAQSQTAPSLKPKATAFLQGIRALDALGAGASNHEIGMVLFATDVSEHDTAEFNVDVKAHDCIKSATKNMNGGYRAIARRSTPIPIA